MEKEKVVSIFENAENRCFLKKLNDDSIQIYIFHKCTKTHNLEAFKNETNETILIYSQIDVDEKNRIEFITDAVMYEKEFNATIISGEFREVTCEKLREEIFLTQKIIKDVLLTFNIVMELEK